MSIAAVAFVGALVVGATIAYFSDTETSSGNIFTAGNIDLKVDHLKQVYNGVDCKTCEVTAVSDTTNMVVEKNGVAITPSYPAVPVTWIHSAWTADVDGTVDDAKWIWATDPTTSPNDTQQDTTYTFRKEFTWYGPFTGASVTFAVAADNSYKVKLNGNQIAADSAENNFSSSDAITVSFTPIQGINVLEFEVKNWAQNGGTSQTNPAGLLYKLVIDGNCGDNYFKTHCTLFGEKDLQHGDYFFNFNDIKPGDLGVNVISVHVYTNDAWMCLMTQPTSSSVLYDGTDAINMYAWIDANKDGVKQSGENELSGPNTMKNVLEKLSIYAPGVNGGVYLPGNTESDIGLAWCAGALTVNTDNTSTPFSCNGSQMGNDAKSAQLQAAITLYAEQQRHNAGFSCASVELPK